MIGGAAGAAGALALGRALSSLLYDATAFAVPSRSRSSPRSRPVCSPRAARPRSIRSADCARTARSPRYPER
ncbi:MAG: hypothetical protein DMF94_21970 [Acidobacteria bacterium]|nr:MAG: hypothetical protein DMF94_21970 [Acidobacteriota bacterium]